MLPMYVSIIAVISEGMLQIFCIDVLKVDQDITYVAMAIHVCCKCIFQMFYLIFHMYVTSVFILMLRMFHTYVC